MSVPGSNLLRQAKSVIRFEDITYFMAASRTTSDDGLYQSKFGPGKTRQGSVQAVPRSAYTYQGLDMQKEYVNLFQCRDAEDLGRDTSGDQFVWNNKRWQVQSNTEWFGMDGWTQSLCYMVGLVP